MTYRKRPFQFHLLSIVIVFITMSRLILTNELPWISKYIPWKNKKTTTTLVTLKHMLGAIESFSKTLPGESYVAIVRNARIPYYITRFIETVDEVWAEDTLEICTGLTLYAKSTNRQRIKFSA
jgi:hypothetical protein